MRLQIQPLSLWVAYTITRPDAIEQMLPPNLRLASTRILSEDTSYSSPAPKLLFNSYDVASTFMRGHRLDIQTLAYDEDKKTIHLVLLDCLSNTFIWDPLNGVRSGNAHVKRKHTKKRFGPLSIARRGVPQLEVEGTMGDALVEPDRKFIVDANRECYFANVSAGYKMTFDEDAIMAPVKCLPLASVSTNKLWKSYRSPRPSHVFVHTMPMTFDVAVPELWYS